MWDIEILDSVVKDIDNLPTSIKAKMTHIMELLERYGNEVGEPHTKALGDGLYEIRAKGSEGIARAFFTFKKGKMIIILHCFIKKSDKIPVRELKRAREILGQLKD